MFDRSDEFIAPYHQVLSRSAIRLSSALLATGSLLLSVAVVVGTSQASLAKTNKVKPSQAVSSIEVQIPIVAQSQAEVESHVIPDGAYLYGQLPEAEQIGTGYMVFESRQDRLVGAFYYPQSSFDCFYGRREFQSLNLTVVNSYDNTTHAYGVGLNDYTVASINNPVATFELEGLHRIEEISENDTRILEICKANYQDEIWN